MKIILDLLLVKDGKKDRKKKKGFKQTKTTKNNMDWSE
jgi:hypothetical protein